uniref:N-myc downstream regulated 1b n=1 Tax=Oryzias sinensis TaxID=183150 RepID=A0A8C7ZSU6_9TELE
MVLEENDCDSVFEPHATEEYVETPYGDLHCIMTGTPKANRPVILTFHDVGLNHKSCFETLFTHEDMQEIVKHLPVCHVEAPGQQEAAKSLPTSYSYPTVDQLSEALPAVLKNFGLRSVIGLGVGAGAYILARFALNHPDLVDGLVLINVNPNAEGLMDSVANKITDWTQTLPDKLIAHLFGQEEIQNNYDLVATYRHYITATMNQSNVSQFFRSYNNRSTLDVQRPVSGGNINVRTLKCSTLLVVGDNSPAVEAVVDLLQNVTYCTFDMADCGSLPQVDQPAKVTEALKYFIQGLGYCESVYNLKLLTKQHKLVQIKQAEVKFKNQDIWQNLKQEVIIEKLIFSLCEN